MQSLGSFVRGNTIEFTVVFFDADKNPVDPPGAVMTLTYVNDSDYVTTEFNLVSGPNHTWTASWESSLCSGGDVSGHAETDTPTPFSAGDFNLVITRNAANL